MNVFTLKFELSSLKYLKYFKIWVGDVQDLGKRIHSSVNRGNALCDRIACSDIQDV